MFLLLLFFLFLLFFYPTHTNINRDGRNSSKVWPREQTVRKKLPHDESPISKEIRVANVTPKVIGVLTPKGANMMVMDQNDIVPSPLTIVEYQVSDKSGSEQSSSLFSSSFSSSAISTQTNTRSNLYPARQPNPKPRPQASSTYQAPENVIMKVLLNTEDQGDYFFRLTPERDVLFPPEVLLNMGFKKIPEKAEVEIEGKKYVSLSALLPNVRFAIDEKTSALNITAEPGLLRKNTFDLAARKPYKVLYTKDNSAFLNYRLNHRFDNDVKLSSLNYLWDAGVSTGNYLGFSSFSYTRSDTRNRTEEKFVRLMTNATYDDPLSLRRYILGDFPAFSGSLGGAATLGGLSVSKNYSINPYLIRYPGLNLSGALKTPSDVNVYVNNMLVKNMRLPAGEFEFLNLPFFAGAGNTAVVIEDAFGNKERIETPFYLSTGILKPGLQEYSYNLGFERERIGQESSDYTDLAFMGFHRLGITNAFSAGFRAEAGQNVFNVGPTADFLLWRAGEINTSLALSRFEGGKPGYGGALGYTYAGRDLSGRFSVRGFSRDYANLSLSPSQDNSRLEWSAGLGYILGKFGSVAATFSVIDKYNATGARRTSLSYTTRLTTFASLFINASRTKADEVINEVFAGLNIVLGKDTSGGISYTAQQSQNTETAYIRKNPAPGSGGYGYNLLAERREDTQGEAKTGGNAAFLYNSSYATYAADYRRAEDLNSYGLNISGSLSYIGQSLYLSRPINDSFALVKVRDLENVKVYCNNQEVDTTTRKGDVLVPNLISYYDNNLSIDAGNIPVNYELSEVRRHVSTPYRGGGVVKFEAKKVQGFTGRLFFMENGKKVVAEYWGVEIQLEDRLVEGIVGKEGTFYFENMPPGTFTARIFLKDKERKFKLVIPESNDMMVDMGEIICGTD